MPVEPHNGRHRAFVAAHVVLTTLATLFVVARLMTKRIKRLPLTLDDLLLVIALFVFYGVVAGSFVSVTIGHVGYHMSTASPKELKLTLLLLWFLQIPHAVALTLIRCSIAILFTRAFFTHIFPKLKCAAHTCMVFSVLWLLVALVVNLLHCRPIYHNWRTPLENSDFCFRLKPYVIFMASWGLILDGLTWSLPHVVVWRLQLRRAHKIAITAIFSLGTLCEDGGFFMIPSIFANSVRSNIVMAVFCITSLLGVPFKGDLTYDAVPAIVWAIAQVSTAIIVACCPLLCPVLEKLVPKRLTRTPAASIRVTTRIDVLADSSALQTQGCFHDRFQEVQGPTFEIERGVKGGCLRGVRHCTCCFGL